MKREASGTVRNRFGTLIRSMGVWRLLPGHRCDRSQSMSHLQNVIGLQEADANGAVIQSMRRNPFIVGR